MAHQFFKAVKNSIRYWYIPLIVGLIFVVTGLYTFTAPEGTYLTLAFIFSISFLVSGLSDIVFSISNRNEVENWGWTLVFGLLTFLIGIVLVIHPAISVTTLPLYVGFVVLFRSIAAISYSLDLKNYGVSQWGRLMILGVLGVIFSFILIWNPLFGGLTIVIWTGIALISAGIFSILLSLKLKKLHDVPNKLSKDLKEKFESISSEIQKELKNK